jgi:BirA family biotin operon repressor/biotin-[acetyl-CoA-carboxylase] ligase
MSFDQEIQQFQGGLSTSCLGRRLCAVKQTDSTNRLAGDLAAKTEGEGLLVVADQQSAGRGRLDRQWFSPPGHSLLCSLLLRPRLEQAKFPQLAVVTAISLHQALTEAYPQTPLTLKWPNDVIAGGRKISGILCEGGHCPGHAPHVVVGLGVNVSTPLADFPPELQKTASSLLALTGRLVPRYQLLAVFLLRLEANYSAWQEQGNLQHLLPYWQCFDCLRGQPVRVELPKGQILGIADGLHEDGRLRLLQDGALQLICAGDIVHARQS